MEKQQYDQFIARKQRVSRTIDPDSAKALWIWGGILDPYGLHRSFFDDPDEEDNISRICFAIAPDGEWIAFEDLPKETVAKLRSRSSAWADDNRLNDN